MVWRISGARMSRSWLKLATSSLPFGLAGYYGVKIAFCKTNKDDDDDLQNPGFGSHGTLQFDSYDLYSTDQNEVADVRKWWMPVTFLFNGYIGLMMFLLHRRKIGWYGLVMGSLAVGLEVTLLKLFEKLLITVKLTPDQEHLDIERGLFAPRRERYRIETLTEGEPDKKDQKKAVRVFHGIPLAGPDSPPNAPIPKQQTLLLPLHSFDNLSIIPNNELLTLALSGNADKVKRYKYCPK